MVMPKALPLACLMVIVSVAACAPAPAPVQGTPDEEVTIRGMGSRYAAAFNGGDVPAMARMVAENFECVEADGTQIRGRAAFQQMEEAAAKQRTDAGLKLTLNITTGYVTWTSGTSAVVGGQYTIAGVPPGASDKGAWMTSVKKDADGEWRITNSLISEFVAPPPAPADTKGKGK
jgi:uncharacterized protein (TIGR02246 family)